MSEILGLDFSSSDEEYWPIIIGSESNRLDKFLKEDKELSDRARDKIFATSAKILSQCPNPRKPYGSKTGLVIGKVQSGKTSQFISLISLAIDNGYRIIIIFGGRTNALLGQNNDRLWEYLDLEKRPDRVSPFSNPTTADHSEMLAILEGGNTVVISVLKHQGRINDLKDLLSSSELSIYPTLIIDDEGDQATPNTLVNKGRKSSIYKAAMDLRSVLKNHAFLSITATPQANLLIRTWDVLSPEFCVLVEPGEGYCGGSTFFGVDKEKFLRKISNTASLEIGDGLPEEVINAVGTFLVGAAIRSLRGDKKPHSMLIHTSSRTNDHEVVTRKVRALIQLWRQALSLNDDDPGNNGIKKILKAAYDDIASTVSPCPSWNQIYQQSKHEIRQLKEDWMVNSLPQGRNPTTMPRRLKNNIYIGGNMLDRGVTIDGLAVTVITRTSKEQQADTVEQRARWYGYKEKYLDVCRIYATEDIFETFKELQIHEDDFWDSLRRNEEQGIPIKEWPRLFKLGLQIKPTRSNVAAARTYYGTGWTIEHKVSISPEITSNNLQVIKRFLTKNNGRIIKFGNVEHLLVRIPAQDALDNLLSKIIFDENTDWDHPYSTEYLQRLILRKKLDEIDVLLMSKGDFRERTPNGGRIQPMQGHSPHRKASDPDYYPGDEHLHQGRVQLQVHLIRLKDSGIETTALALYVPLKSQYDMGRHVVPNE
ncbi:Z1 domain-containing protein [Brevibacillus agri]|uniref:Z1 domain-containing protein n=1 Tax=Brevibacillus agri TaxID=51101 RepID=UPI003D19D013